MNKTKQVAYDGLFIAIGIVFAMLIHGIGGVKLGQVVLPIHYAPILAGLLIGPWDGLIVGVLTPLLSSMLIGMPPFMPPIGVFMIFEMATYGFIVGYLNKRKINIYVVLLIAMIIGRIVYSLSYYVIGYMVGIHLLPLLAVIASFLSGAMGAILQLLLVPLIYYAARNHNLIGKDYQ